MKPYHGRIIDWQFEPIGSYFPVDCMPIRIIGVMVDHPRLKGPVQRTSALVKAEMVDGRIEVETLNSRYTLMQPWE